MNTITSHGVHCCFNYEPKSIIGNKEGPKFGFRNLLDKIIKKKLKSTMLHFVILYHASIFLMNGYSKVSLRHLLLISLELYTRTFRKEYKISLEIFNISELCS